MIWTTEREEKLTKLWGEGLSASQCARRLGGFDDTADGGRNAVLSKIHRLKLQKRATTQRSAQATGGTKGALKMRARRLAKKAKSAGTPISALAAALKSEPFVSNALEVPIHERKTLADLGDQDCRFPYGDGPFTFCARPRAVGLSYCPAHAAACYQPPKMPANQSTLARGGHNEQGGVHGSQNDNMPASEAELKDLEGV